MAKRMTRKEYEAKEDEIIAEFEVKADPIYEEERGERHLLNEKQIGEFNQMGERHAAERKAIYMKYQPLREPFELERREKLDQLLAQYEAGKPKRKGATNG